MSNYPIQQASGYSAYNGGQPQYAQPQSQYGQAPPPPHYSQLSQPPQPIQFQQPPQPQLGWGQQPPPSQAQGGQSQAQYGQPPPPHYSQLSQPPQPPQPPQPIQFQQPPQPQPAWGQQPPPSQAQGGQSQAQCGQAPQPQPQSGHSTWGQPQAPPQSLPPTQPSQFQKPPPPPSWGQPQAPPQTQTIQSTQFTQQQQQQQPPSQPPQSNNVFSPNIIDTIKSFQEQGDVSKIASFSFTYQPSQETGTVNKTTGPQNSFFFDTSDPDNLSASQIHNNMFPPSDQHSVINDNTNNGTNNINNNDDSHNEDQRDNTQSTQKAIKFAIKPSDPRQVKLAQPCKCKTCILDGRDYSQQRFTMRDQIQPDSFKIGNPSIDTSNFSKTIAEPQTAWKSAFYGLVGMALGDALGYMYENCRPREVVETWPVDGAFPSECLEVGLSWTDDTQHSLSLMEAFMCPNQYTTKSEYAPLLRAGLNYKEVLELWRVLASKKPPTGANVEYGGFRGTGNNFRTSMYKVLDKAEDQSSYTAGNGVVMKTIPIGIAAHDSELATDRQRLTVMSKNIINVSKLMSHSLLAVTPAFATAYLAYLWTNPDDTIRATNKSRDVVDLLEDINANTKLFEDMVAKDGFFMRNSWDKDLVHCFSWIVDRIITHLKGLGRDFNRDEAMVDIALFVTHEISNTITDKPVLSFNDGLGITSAISAVLFALFYRDKPFLGVLQAMFYYGGDTDSVGAVLGGLLGAYSEWIDKDIMKVLIYENRLYKYFERFVNHVLERPSYSRDSISWPRPIEESFIDIEVDVNRIISENKDRMKKPNKYKSSYYQ